ncbi:hypothetical protein O181_086111 [Austropuccinia psidii MF-1]|uniref:Uncharacterized protein n=1 Tax=Austropuccinia psidii MF-1 TaxID=1389203 RepID=A0A9Q3FZJ3_9BASI|nr:hypothetical protein [Austropuccinia psidii MF-1]
MKRISDSPTDPDGDGSDAPDGEEVEVMDLNIGQIQNYSHSHPPTGAFQGQIIPSMPRNSKSDFLMCLPLFTNSHPIHSLLGFLR